MVAGNASARACALDVLDAVLPGRRPLDEALGDQPDLARLATSDRAFARTLVTTTLRRLGQIDALIDHCLDHPLTPKARPVQNLLRVGVCQLVFLETPPHAAVDTTVSLAQARGQGPYKRLVNALLRRLAREGAALLKVGDAARLNTPDWLWASWSGSFGEGVCRGIAEAHLAEPPLDVTVRRDPAGWAERLGAAVLPTGTLRCFPSGPVPELPGFADGEWWVQDAAAALPARLLGDVAGRRVIDLGAAPGGKTAQLAAAGARVTAVDRSAARLGRLRSNLTRLCLEAEIVAADALRWRPETPADGVLLDVPCTATGAIRRHPDVAWLKTAEDVARLSRIQARLLEAAVEMVKPGGLVVYSSCSLQPEEGTDRIAELLDGGAPVEPAPVAPDEVGGLAEILTAGGELRSLPCHMAREGGMDGFFAARLRRR